MEVTTQKRCSNCHELGHNKRSCLSRKITENKDSSNGEPDGSSSNKGGAFARNHPAAHKNQRQHQACPGKEELVEEMSPQGEGDQAGKRSRAGAVGVPAGEGGGGGGGVDGSFSRAAAANTCAQSVSVLMSTAAAGTAVGGGVAQQAHENNDIARKDTEAEKHNLLPSAPAVKRSVSFRDFLVASEVMRISFGAPQLHGVGGIGGGGGNGGSGGSSDAADDSDGSPTDIEESEEPLSAQREEVETFLRQRQQPKRRGPVDDQAPDPTASGGSAARGARFHPRVLATFMFKGGVYKSTTTIHAAAAIAGELDGLHSCTYYFLIISESVWYFRTRARRQSAHN